MLGAAGDFYVFDIPIPLNLSNCMKAEEKITQFESGAGAGSRLNSADHEGQLESLRYTISERDRQIEGIKQSLADENEEVRRLAAIVESARLWQKKSWFQRALHKWRPEEKSQKARPLEKLSKSIQKRTEKPVGNAPEEAVAALQSIPSEMLFEHFKGNPFQEYARNLQDACKLKPSLQTGYISRTDSPLLADHLDVRAIAFYLPQFHPIPENDLWWGKGFTEWTNVSRAVPQFIGHYQPRLPGDLGFYDLRLPEIMRQQVEIAKDYGINGFCFHHYWFNGRRLLEKPFNDLLNNPDLDINFCLCWANENWSRRWDGSEQDILMEQKYSPEDDIAFIDDLIPAFRDKRYIRVHGRPLLIVYRATLFPDIEATTRRWRERVKEHGIDGIYLVAARSFDVGNPQSFGFDAGVEFPPHQIHQEPVNESHQIINPEFSGKIFDYVEMAEKAGSMDPSEFISHKTVVPTWDNTARKPGTGHTYVNSTPNNYANWLDQALQVTLRRPAGERLLFINAWNEWGEGAHLEPDRRFGYAYLNATANVLAQTYHDSAVDSYITSHNARFQKTSDTAVVVHLYYADLFPDLLARYFSKMRGADFFISVRYNAPLTLLQEIAAAIPECYFIKVDHRGRDMFPFLVTLDRLAHFGYQYACKLHTKKSPQFEDGHQWRNQLLECLVGGKDPLTEAKSVFEADPALGVLLPDDATLDLSVRETCQGNVMWLDRLLGRMDCSRHAGTYDFKFPAGSMFWFRVDALRGFLDLKIEPKDFAHEIGQLDGTLAHTLERLILLMAAERGYHYQEINLSHPLISPAR